MCVCSLGATRTKDAKELLYARQKVVVTTKAFGLQAIDLVYIDYKDVEGLRRQAREGALMGFTGKDLCTSQQSLCICILTSRPCCTSTDFPQLPVASCIQTLQVSAITRLLLLSCERFRPQNNQICCFSTGCSSFFKHLRCC